MRCISLGWTKCNAIVVQDIKANIASTRFYAAFRSFCVIIPSLVKQASGVVAVDTSL